MSSPLASPHRVAALICGVLLSACTATTTVTITPPDQAPIYQPQSGLKTAVQWRTQWRPNQKNVPEREAAAAQGIGDFFADSTCFPSTSVTRVDSGHSHSVVIPPGSDRLLVLTVRELGPVVKLLSSAALVEGGTEVVVDVTQYLPGRIKPDRQLTIHWQNGGPGVVKGVQSLSADMNAALRAGLTSPQSPRTVTQNKPNEHGYHGAKPR